MTSLLGQHAVVTGASRGIGAAIAEALAAEGAQLTLVGRNRDRLTSMADRLHARSLVLDVADEKAVTAAFGALEPVDVLINCAGTSSTASLMGTTREQWDGTLAVNLTALWLASSIRSKWRMRCCGCVGQGPRPSPAKASSLPEAK